jgi:hypothetical protein
MEKSKHCVRCMARRFYNWARFGEVRAKIVGTIANVPCEISYIDSKGREVGYWAYGYFDPRAPYQGDC